MLHCGLSGHALKRVVTGARATGGIWQPQKCRRGQPWGRHLLPAGRSSPPDVTVVRLPGGLTKAAWQRARQLLSRPWHSSTSFS